MKKVLFGLLAAGLLTALSAVHANAGDKPRSIRIGNVGGGYGEPFSSGALGTAYVKGWLDDEFKKDGIKVEWTFYKGAGPAINEALANGTIDFGNYGDLCYVIGKNGGIKIKGLASGGGFQEVYALVPIDSQAKTLKDLKGKRLGLFKGTYIHLQFDKILEENGLSEKDFKVYNYGTADALAALASKDIDVIVGAPAVLSARTEGLARVIYDSKKEPAKVKGKSALVVTEAFEKKYPEIVQRVLNVYVKASAWDGDEKNRDELFHIWAKSGTTYEQEVESYAGTPSKYFSSPLLDEFFLAHYVTGQTFAKDKGIVRRTSDVKTWFDDHYLATALKSQGLENYFPRFDTEGNEIKN